LSASGCRFGDSILARAERLAAITQDAPRLTRAYLTPEHRQAGELIASWMREAGMSVHWDALGNVVGRYEGAVADAPVLMTGSHLDTVRNAGRYDGLFGILSPIACVADLHRRGVRLPVAIEVVAFGDEEGVRFGVTLIGSKAMAGAFNPAWLDATDADGLSMRDALREFGGDPEAVASVDRRDKGVVAFIESHIEQGPVLLNAGLSLGVVTAIAVRAVSAASSPDWPDTPARCRCRPDRTRSPPQVRWCWRLSGTARCIRVWSVRSGG